MSVVALVCDVSEARPVVTWAARFAAALDTDLIIFSPIDSLHSSELAITTGGEEQFADALSEAIQKVIETVVRTRKARKGRLPKYAVSLRRFADPDPVASTISRVKVEVADLFVGAGALTNGTIKQKTVTQQVAARVPCDTVLLYSGEDRSVKGDHIIAVASDGSHDKKAIELAAHTALAAKGKMIALGVEECVGEGAIEVGMRGLRSIFRDLNLTESRLLEVKTIQAEDRVQAVAEEATDCDLLVIGADAASRASEFIVKTERPTVAVIRKASQLSFGRGQKQASAFLPPLHPADYADLYEKLQSGSRWNIDFVVMLSLAAGIATLGLLQSSPAVVIGSMLLAPLMTPMIGMGLALNQGNSRLAYTCFRSISRGFLAGLVISGVVGLITPGQDLTPEILARTEPNILDLLIALFSGMAAAYALARPSLAGTIAGVAIATALVPPTCAAGVCLAYCFADCYEFFTKGSGFAYGFFELAVGASLLLTANVLAIILAAAITFRTMGLNASRTQETRRRWVSRAVVGMTICFITISIPLTYKLDEQVHEGRASPMALTVTNATRKRLLEYVDTLPGIDIILVGRPGIPREYDPVDVGIILSSIEPLPRAYKDKLTEIVRDEMQNPELRVHVECVASNWAEPVGVEADEGAGKAESGEPKAE